MKPARERLLEAVGGEWESSGPIATRAGVNRKAAGQMLAALYRAGSVERRIGDAGGNWVYRR